MGHPRVLLAIGAAAAVAVSGCAGFGQQQSFDFESDAGKVSATSGEEITVELPEGLREAATTKDQTLLVNSFRASARELEGSGQCAIDVAVDYADDGAETLAEPSTAGGASVPDGSTPPARLAIHLIELNEDRYRAQEAAPENPPADGTFIPAINGDAYVSGDLQSVTYVSACADSPDPANALTLRFPLLDAAGTSTKTVAQVSFVAGTNGAVAIADHKVLGFKRDSGGNWSPAQ